MTGGSVATTVAAPSGVVLAGAVCAVVHLGSCGFQQHVPGRL
jgi:hypothetical protein